MGFLKTIRSSMGADAGEGDSPQTAESTGDEEVTGRYAKLNERNALEELGRLNQAELTAVEQFERSNRGREAVLNKLRYLRQPEPLPGYDELEPAAISEALAGADATTIKAVRTYERKLQNRPGVIKEIAAALHRVQPRRVAGDGGPDTGDDVPASMNGSLPIKVRPESGLGTP